MDHTNVRPFETAAAVSFPSLGLEPPDLKQLIDFDAICLRAENKSDKTVDLTALALRRLRQFLEEKGLSTRADDIGARELRAFILELRHSPRFIRHPYVKKQPTILSPHAVNTYLRAIRAAWNRWLAEGLVLHTPFEHVRLPGVPRKVMPTFTDAQLDAILQAINTKTPVGFRDYILIKTYLDTICRLSEITSVQIPDLDLNARRIKVMGKGRRERYVYFGVKVQKLLWKYVNVYRPAPQLPTHDNLFLTHDGRPLSKNRVEAIVKKYATRAGITGVRLSPHTLRHTACLMYVRNGGDLFSLQAITGHSSLNVLRNYVNLNSDDVQVAHRKYSPIDNLKPTFRR